LVKKHAEFEKNLVTLNNDEKSIKGFIDATGILKDKTLHETFSKLRTTFATVFCSLVPEGEVDLRLVSHQDLPS
jgi:chromosome segregation ATPase